MINPLLSSKLNWNNGHKPTNHTSLDKHMRVSNACNMDFHLFIVLDAKLLIAGVYFALYLGHA